MTTLAAIQKQIAELERKAESIRKSEAAKAADKVRELIARHELTAADIGLSGRVSDAPPKKGATASRQGAAGTAASSAGKTKTMRQRMAGVARYRDPASGKTWTGNGKAPGWIAGAKNREPFLIDSGDGNTQIDSTPPASATKKASARRKVTRKPRSNAAMPTPVQNDPSAVTPVE